MRAGRRQVERRGLDAVDVAQAVSRTADALEQPRIAERGLGHLVRRRAVAGEEEEAAVGALARPEVPGGRVDVRSQRARRAPALAAAAAGVDVVRAAGVR